ncbi:uncharacterized protein DUF5118 [Sediminitomix flava]|uniref:Uncharacterized protein DUF5118 n=2 Tax=Sediminitomix flava TaxID=379075 RepID=A0A315ZH87_SEDFL|nr:uncharacterized protein DUF5118 [Sediminitomix flava]
MLLLSLFSLSFAKAQSIKTYQEIIDANVTSQKGMFTVHQKDDKLYFEIPDQLLDKEMLMAARVAEVSDPSKAFAGEMRRNPLLCRFRRNEKNVYLLVDPNHYELQDDSNIKNALARQSLLPVYQTFPILAFDENKTSAVIDVTDFFSKEIELITPFASKGKPGKLDAKSSGLDQVLVFENNIEVQHFFNYTTKTTPFRAKINRSILLLPEPMMARRYDRRLNYFSTSGKTIADNGDVIGSYKNISRFRVEPKPQDREKYFRGELVEPQKPIVFYVDNGFPDRWAKHIKQGIEDWQVAFEAIGFKNAVIAKDFPKDDPTFNPNDLQHNVFRYVTTNTINAAGPRWVDPRTGEVIRSQVIWFHNVIQKLHDWYLVQTSAVDERARAKVYEDELLGRLIRYAAAHEIGHNLGFQHNMRASYAYPVESLRDAEFTQKYGTTPSIMDYARFNYIAQPGDKGVSFTPPKIGVYDMYALKWGYQLIEGIQTPEDEYDTLNQWILEKANDPRYRFTPQFAMGISDDPASQAEALGDDGVKAGTYGVKNTRYIMSNIIDWTVEEGHDYKYLDRINKALIKQYKRYLHHNISYLGGAYTYLGVEGEEKALRTPVTKKKQQEALTWLFTEITSNEWLVNPEVEKRLGDQRKDWYKFNTDILDEMMSGYIYQRMQANGNEYTADEYVLDLGELVWSLNDKKGKLTEMEMILQQAYIHNLKNMTVGVTLNKDKKQKSAFSPEEALSRGSASKVNYVDRLLRVAAYQAVERADKAIAKELEGPNRVHFMILKQMLEE